MPCSCARIHPVHRIVLTGGPGAGKTAILEMIRQASFCDHVRILPEAASIVFGGGFPRRGDVAGARAAQRAIFYVQRELEEAAQGDNPAILLCDRGTIDGLAYWPGPQDYFTSVGTTLAEELGRYHAVLHLRTPPAENGYNHRNPLRTESAGEAADIDLRILRAWAMHPRRTVVDPSLEFLSKIVRVLDILRMELPECCRHRLAAPDEMLKSSHRAENSAGIQHPSGDACDATKETGRSALASSLPINVT